MDSFSDVLLIAIPLYQLWHISSRTSERRLIRLVFSASVITLMASIGLCIISYGKILVGPGGPLVWLMACQIFVSNLHRSVLTYLLKTYKPRRQFQFSLRIFSSWYVGYVAFSQPTSALSRWVTSTLPPIGPMRRIKTPYRLLCLQIYHLLHTHFKQQM